LQSLREGLTIWQLVEPLNSFTCALSEAQGEELRAYLDENGYVFSTVPYARFAASKPKIKIVFYQSGKLVVQGKETREFVEFILEPLILKRAGIGYETVLDPGILIPRIGVDESGKGDFFGPLCVAGVYVNADVIKAWEGKGIRDSKNISSDKKINDLADLIRKTPGCVTAVVPIGNEAYNRLYRKIGSVNQLLAWGHARVIENLMDQADRLNPPPQRAISDQFAAHESTVTRALMKLGRQIELIQKHRAESDLAVAAASILARSEFITRLAALEKSCGVRLPRGASAAVDAAAREVLTQLGAETLGKVSKMHFRTAYRALGLPEPPVVEWVKRGNGSSSGEQKKLPKNV
jgi:ribonuclease HIII